MDCLSGTRLYKIYSGMKQRCYNKNNQHYRWYGEKGISICDEWMGENGFVNFFNWSLLNGYRDDLTIDRIHSDDNYSPENCRWITRSENSSSVCKKYTEKSTSSGIKALLSLTGKKQSDLMDILRVSSKQSLSNKFSNERWSAEDIAAVADFCGCKLAFILPDGQKIYIENDTPDR